MNIMSALQSFIKKGGTPQQLLQNMTMQNPILNNLIGMAKSNNPKGVEDFARNMFKEQGRDFDKEFAEFKGQFKS